MDILTIEKHSSLQPSGCRLWLGGIQNNGYGQVRYRGKTHSVHRVVYELYKGSIPEGLHVCHSCDTRRCINIDHLFVGSKSVNMLDARSKGRVTNQKLTSEEVDDIKGLILIGKRLTDIAVLYNVSKSTISDIKAGRTWKE